MKSTTRSLHALIIPLILPLLAGHGSPLTASLLLLEDFETDGLGIRYNATGAFSDGVDDYFTRTDGTTEASGIPAFTGFGGSHFWAAEDIDATENPGGLALLDFTGVTVAPFPAVRVALAIGAGSGSAFDSVDDFVLVQYRFDAGPWLTALAFQNNGQVFNGPLVQDTDFDGIGDGLHLGLALQTFTSLDLPVTGALMDLRVDLLLNSGSEEVAFDNITVTGVPEPSASALALACACLLLLAGRRRFLPCREE